MAIPCAGIIVFDGDKTLLVVTKCGNYSFPKGKKNKNESDENAAWRELSEETGLTAEHVRLIENCYIDEMSSRGYPSVRYFIGYLVQHPESIKFDPNELAGAEWYKVSSALEITKFKTARKIILKDAFAIFKNKL